MGGGHVGFLGEGREVRQSFCDGLSRVERWRFEGLFNLREKFGMVSTA